MLGIGLREKDFVWALAKETVAKSDERPEVQLHSKVSVCRKGRWSILDSVYTLVNVNEFIQMLIKGRLGCGLRAGDGKFLPKWRLHAGLLPKD